MLIVGLGNPGKEYENTFHNMGYMVLDALAEALNKKINRLECSSMTAVGSVNGEKVVLAKPLTYMNASGAAVKSLMAKYGAKAEELIVVYDDIDLPRFTLRVRERGGAGTHNGMRNVLEAVGEENFKRIRMGIGKNEFDLKDYVLGKISAEDLKRFRKIAAEIALLIVQYLKDGDFEKLMREGNATDKLNGIG